MVYICSSSWLLAGGPHDLTQAEKKVTVAKAEQIKKSKWTFDHWTDADHLYTANVYRGLQGDQGFFLQNLQGKPYDIYKIFLQSVNITGFSLQILQKNLLITQYDPVNICSVKHLFYQ